MHYLYLRNLLPALVQTEGIMALIYLNTSHRYKHVLERWTYPYIRLDLVQFNTR